MNSSLIMTKMAILGPVCHRWSSSLLWPQFGALALALAFLLALALALGSGVAWRDTAIFSGSGVEDFRSGSWHHSFQFRFYYI